MISKQEWNSIEAMVQQKMRTTGVTRLQACKAINKARKRAAKQTTKETN